MARNFSLRIIHNIIGIIEIALLIRVALRALQANELAFVVKLVYNVSDDLIGPVNYIFPNIPVGGSVIDIVAISAMVFYAAVYLLSDKIIKTIWPE